MKKPFDIETWGRKNPECIIIIIKGGVVQDVMNAQSSIIIDYDNIDQSGECPFCAGELVPGEYYDVNYSVVCRQCGWVGE
jgi:hypothetical protein